MIRTRGLRQVMAFNWPKLVAGTGAVALAAARWGRLPGLVRLVVLGGTFWTPVSLAASWWTYDLSPLRHWRFLEARLPSAPERVLLVVAGFDEVSPVVTRLWPQATITTVDIVRSPEPSVRRARRWYPADVPVVAPAELAAFAGKTSYDLVLFAQSAHEIRDERERSLLFAAARSVVGTAGRVVVVEHLRDLPNAVAFGPGALHFTRRSTWLRAFSGAGLTVVDDRAVTALVGCWTLAP